MRPGPPSPSRRRPPRRQPPQQRHPARPVLRQWQRQRRLLPSTPAIFVLLLLGTGPGLALVDSPLNMPIGLPNVPGYHQPTNQHHRRFVASSPVSSDSSFIPASSTSISSVSASSSSLSIATSSRSERIRGPRNLTVGYLTAIKGGLKDRQGLAISGALTMALDEINNDMRILPDVRLVMRWNDTRGETVEATKAMIDMICDGVTAFFGPEGSCHVEAIVSQSRNIPMISYREPFQLKKLLANNKQLLNPNFESRSINETEKKCNEDDADSNDLPSDEEKYQAEMTALSNPQRRAECNSVGSPTLRGIKLDKKMRTGDGDKESSSSNIGNPETHDLFPKRPRIAWDTAHTAHTSQPHKKIPSEEFELSVEQLQKVRLQKLIEQDAELANARLAHENKRAFMNIMHEEELLKLKLQQAKELFALQRKSAIVKLKTQRIELERLMKMESEDLLS